MTRMQAENLAFEKNSSAPKGVSWAAINLGDHWDIGRYDSKSTRYKRVK